MSERDVCLITLLMIKEKSKVSDNSVLLLINSCLRKGYRKPKYMDNTYFFWLDDAGIYSLTACYVSVAKWIITFSVRYCNYTI